MVWFFLNSSQKVRCSFGTVYIQSLLKSIKTLPSLYFKASKLFQMQGFY